MIFSSLVFHKPHKARILASLQKGKFLHKRINKSQIQNDSVIKLAKSIKKKKKVKGFFLNTLDYQKCKRKKSPLTARRIIYQIKLIKV